MSHRDGDGSILDDDKKYTVKVFQNILYFGNRFQQSSSPMPWYLSTDWENYEQEVAELHLTRNI